MVKTFLKVLWWQFLVPRSKHLLVSSATLLCKIQNIGLFQKKKTNREGGVEDMLLLTPLKYFIFTFPLEIPDKTKLHPWQFHKTVLDSLKIPRSKTKTPRNSTLFFLGHRWKFHFANSTKLLLPWKFHMLFLWYDTPRNSISSPPPPFLFFFSGIAHFDFVNVIVL